MCGITGVIGPGAKDIDLKESLSALSLRGPDRQAEIITGTAHLGHARLSIIDTSSMGDQPMQDPSGRYTLVFNGEIYNYHTIAESLEQSGVSFRSKSDTEVLLHLLIQKGRDALKELNGFFAIAFHDAEEDSLLLARDRIGIKPLYYSYQEERLAFASEMKGLLPLIGRKNIDHDALHLFFRLNYLPVGTSIFKETEQLEPGESILYKNGSIKKEKFYSGDDVKPQGQSLYELLDDSVRLRLVSDVPLGSFLSGGVDSSIIAALAVRHKPDLKTFSIGFKDNALFDESSYAEKVARHIGSDHLTIQLSEDEMLHHVNGLLEYVDEPFADSSAIAVHALSHHTRSEVTVALSGDGADELFGGYNKHQAHLMAIGSGMKEQLIGATGKLLSGIEGGHGSLTGNFIRKAKRFSEGRNLSALERYWAWASWSTPDDVSRLLDVDRSLEYQEVLKALGPRDNSLEEVLRSDTRSLLPGDMLTKVDRMSMANSLEVRVPFLDHRVVEYAHSLKASERFRKGQGKYILRDSFGHLLPDEIFTRKKKGFEVPLESWFIGPLFETVHSAMSDGVLIGSGLFNAEEINSLRLSLEAKKIGHKVHMLWALLIFHRFYSRYGH